MKVIYFEVGKKARTLEVEDRLEEYQKLVGGYIEVFPLTDGLLLICNEEGKLRGLPFNRVMKGERIVGDFFLCRADEEDFASVTDSDIEKYCN